MHPAATGSVSILIHVAVITGAIFATLATGPAGPRAGPGTAVVVIALPVPHDASSTPPVPDVRLQELQTMTMPAVLPVAIPPFNLQERFDPKDFAGARVEGGSGTPVAFVPDQPYDPSLVDDGPILLSTLPLVSALAPQDGITRRVVVKAVIDTAGRAEPTSVQVIRSADTAFDQQTQQWMLNALWRPARVAGHPVRLWVYRAIDYTITTPR